MANGSIVDGDQSLRNGSSSVDAGRLQGQANISVDILLQHQFDRLYSHYRHQGGSAPSRVYLLIASQMDELQKDVNPQLHGRIR